LSTIISEINWLDVVFLIILLGMIYNGSRAGVGSQLLSLAWWFVLIFFVLNYYDNVASKVFGFMIQNWARAIAFFLIVTGLMGVIKFLESLFKIERVDDLATIERIGGAVMASLRSFLLFGIIGMQLLLIPIPAIHNAAYKGSKSAMFFVNVDATIYSYMTRFLAFIDNREKDQIIGKFISSPSKKD